MSKNTVLLVCASLFAVGDLMAQDPEVQKELKELRERLDELEDQQVKTSEKLGSRALAQAYSALSLDVGGHVTSVFSYIDGEADTEIGHQVSLIELYLKAKLDEQWSLFATPGFYTFNGALLDNPATPTTAGDPSFIRDEIATSDTFLSRILAEWKYSDALTVQGGVVGSPHGITNREYFIPSRAVAAGNLHTRLFLSNQLYPQLLEGLKVSGKLPVGGDTVEYDVYYGTEPDSASDAVYGARLAYVMSDLGLTVAGNYGRGTRETLPTAPVNLTLTNFGALQSPYSGQFNLGRDYEFGGLDLDLRSGDLMMRTELYYSREDGFLDQKAASTEWTWWLGQGKWGVTYRFDYYERGSDLNVFAASVQSLNWVTEHVVGLNFNPNNSVRLRLDLHHMNLPNTDDTVDFVNFSWSASF